MKKNIILAIVGVVFMLGLVGCAQGAPSGFEGTWYIDPEHSSPLWLDVDISANEEEDNYAVISSDGSITFYYTHTSGVSKTAEWKIDTNSCDTFKLSDGTEYKYEVSGDSMRWCLKTGSGLLDAIGVTYCEFSKTMY